MVKNDNFLTQLFLFLQQVKSLSTLPVHTHLNLTKTLWIGMLFIPYHAQGAEVQKGEGISTRSFISKVARALYY